MFSLPPGAVCSVKKLTITGSVADRKTSARYFAVEIPIEVGLTPKTIDCTPFANAIRGMLGNKKQPKGWKTSAKGNQGPVEVEFNSPDTEDVPIVGDLGGERVGISIIDGQVMLLMTLHARVTEAIMVALGLLVDREDVTVGIVSRQSTIMDAMDGGVTEVVMEGGGRSVTLKAGDLDLLERVAANTAGA